MRNAKKFMFVKGDSVRLGVFSLLFVPAHKKGVLYFKLLDDFLKLLPNRGSNALVFCK